MPTLLLEPRTVVVDVSGTPVPGAKRYVYSTGTTTPLATFTDTTLGTPHANPQVADANGVFAPAYLSDSVSSYRRQIRNAADALLSDVDNIPTTAVTQTAVAAALWPRTTAEQSASVTPTNYAYPPLDVRRYGAVTGNSTDCTAAINNALEVARVGGGGTVTCGPGETYRISSKLVLGAYVTLDLNGSVITQHATNTPVVELSGGSGSVVRAGVRNGVLTYFAKQNTSQTSSIGVRLSIASRTNYLLKFEDVQVNNAYRGFDVPNLSGCFAFLVSFNRCLAYDCSDYGWYIQGDTATGGCTNVSLDDCWVAQTSGAETSTSKGYGFVGVSQLSIGNIATDHTQAQYALYCSLCQGSIESFVAESCDYSASAGTNALFFFDSCALSIGELFSTVNNVTISGSADWGLVRVSTSSVEINHLRDINTAVTDTSSGSYYTVICSGTGSRVSVFDYVASGTTPASLLADSSVPYQVVYFDGTDRTVLTGSTTYDPASLADGAGATTTVTVTGAAAGDFATASFSNDLQGITLTAWVSAADTVSVRFQNESGGVLDLASGTLRARVVKAS